MRKQRSRRLFEIFHFIWHIIISMQRNPSNTSGTSVESLFPGNGKGWMDQKRTSYTLCCTTGALVTNNLLSQITSQDQSCCLPWDSIWVKILYIMNIQPFIHYFQYIIKTVIEILKSKMQEKKCTIIFYFFYN